MRLKSYASKKVLQSIFWILTWKSDNFHSKLPQILITEYWKFPKHFLNQFWNFFKIFVKNLLIRSANLLFWLAYLQIISVKNFRSMSIIRPAVHLSQNTQKWTRNAKNKKCITGYFAPLFSHFASPFFAFYISQHFVPGLAFARKLKRFCGLFFAALIKHEIRMKCGKCTAGLTDTLWLQVEGWCVIVLKGENNLDESCGNL